MNACPCAQGLIRAQAEVALANDGFTREQIDRIVTHVRLRPTTSARAARCIGHERSHHQIPADVLIEIVEEGMSSEIYELLKRTDEQYIVDRAHRRPRFVEDSVREMVRGCGALPRPSRRRLYLGASGQFRDDPHPRCGGERSGTLGEIRQELAGGSHSIRHTGVHEWLQGSVLGT